MADDDSGLDSSWTPIPEAARRLGLTQDALRKRIKRGLVESRRGNDRRISVLITSEMLSKSGLDESDTGLDIDSDELAEAEAAIEHWRRLAHAREVELAEMRGELRRAADLVERADEQRRELAAEKDKRIEELKADLAEARKRWWHRFL